MKELVVRLKTFLDHKQLGVIDLARALNYKSPQKLYRLFNTVEASPSCQIIEDISNGFPELNLNWLFTGRGTMIIDALEYTDFKDRYYKCLEEKEDLYKQMITIIGNKRPDGQ